MPIRRVPDTATELLKNFSFQALERTTNSKGIFYYRGTVYKSTRVLVDTNLMKITFMRELKIDGGLRVETLKYDFQYQLLEKTFREPSFQVDSLKTVMYPFCLTEDSHFMQNTIQDNFFPSLQDFVKMEELKNQFVEDVELWIKTRKEVKKARVAAAAAKWSQIHPWASKAKRTSS